MRDLIQNDIWRGFDEEIGGGWESAGD